MDKSELQAKRERWRTFFAQSIGGLPGSAYDAAADAAMYVIVNGGTRDGAVEAGTAAASRFRSAPSDGPLRPERQQTGTPVSRDHALVTAFERRTENLDGTFFQVWSLRLQPLATQQGSRPTIIPVEIRGRAIIGHVSKGDIVRIPAGQSGTTRIVKTIENITTNSVIEAKGRPFRRTRTAARSAGLALKIVGAVLAVAVLVAVAFVVMTLVQSQGSANL